MLFGLLPLLLLTACPKEADPVKEFTRAEQLFAVGNCTEAMILYQAAAERGYRAEIASGRMKVCGEKLALAAARKLGKDAAAKIQVAAPTPAAAPAPPSSATMAATAATPQSSVTRCDPIWRERLSPLEKERTGIEAKIAGIAQKTGAIEAKYPVTVSPRGGYDFALPENTPPDQVKAFQAGPMREYSSLRPELDYHRKRLDEIRAKIAAVEADAAAARVLRECLYPLSR